MSAEEKADELFKKFFRVTPQPYTISQIEDGLWEGLKFNDWDRDWTNKMALQGAIICVEEVISELDPIVPFTNGSSRVVTKGKLSYWQEVKTILENKLK